MNRRIITFLNNISDGFRYIIEIFVVVFFGFAPFFAMALKFSAPMNGEKAGTNQGIFEAAFSGGQIYLYTYSLFGTLMWISLFDWTYAYTKIRLLLVFLVVCLGFFLFGLANIDPTFSKFGQNGDWVVQYGIHVFVASLILYWMILFFRKTSPPDVRNTLEAESLKLEQKFNSLGGSNS